MRIRMNPGVSKILKFLFLVGMVVFMAIIFIKNPAPKLEHIEDTNGADNYELQVITEENILERNIGSKGGPTYTTKKALLGGTRLIISSKQFSGAVLAYSEYLFEGSDIYVDLENYEVEAGNFGVYVVFEGELLGKVEKDENGLMTFLYEDIKEGGTVEYVIAGESANFSFKAPIGWEN